MVHKDSRQISSHSHHQLREAIKVEHCSDLAKVVAGDIVERWPAGFASLREYPYAEHRVLGLYGHYQLQAL
eukprot:194070-Prymnesium_polylepis.1